jgi:hypothetical protein
MNTTFIEHIHRPEARPKPVGESKPKLTKTELIKLYASLLEEVKGAGHEEQRVGGELTKARMRLDSASTEFTAAQEAYSRVAGTKAEKEAHAHLSECRSNLARLQESYDALALAYPKTRETGSTRKRAEAHAAQVWPLILAEIVKEELRTLPPETIKILYRAFSCSKGFLDWKEWLYTIFQDPDPRFLSELQKQVVKDHGAAF